jgi:hypothetical protein
MGTGIHKLVIVGVFVSALGLVGPAFGKPALPEGYKLPSAQPGVWAPMAVNAPSVSTGYTPQAVKALGERGQAMTRYYEESTGYTPQAPQALGERGQSMAEHYGSTAVGSQVANQRQLERLSAIDANQRQVEPIRAVDANQRQFEAPRPAVVVADSGGSFDWNSVGIAVGSAALLALLGLAGILAIRGRSTVAHP